MNILRPALTLAAFVLIAPFAPTSITATGRAFPGRSRPLCVYPLHAHYKGSRSTDDAANFECRP